MAPVIGMYAAYLVEAGGWYAFAGAAIEIGLPAYGAGRPIEANAVRAALTTLENAR